MQRQKSLQSTNRRNVVKNVLLKKIGLGKPHYLLVRSTQKRLESFYKNKFIRGMKDPRLKEYSDFQRCVRIFFPYLSITQELSVEEIKKKLFNTSFRQMVKILPKVYHLDGHISPQVWCREFTYKTFLIKLDFDKIVHLEQSMDYFKLQTELGLDMSIQTNTSKTTQAEIVWDETSIQIVEELYKEDNKLLNHGQ